MAGILGPRAAVDALNLPTGVDGSRVLAFQMRNGKTAQTYLVELAAAIGAKNQKLFDQFGAFMYVTDAPFAYYPAGTGGARRMTPVRTEFKDADAVRGTDGGHMLPLKDFDDALGWTELYMRDERDAQLTADLTLVVNSWDNRVVNDVYSRLLTNTENPIGSGYDVPWAIGTGVNVPYIPQQYASYTFTSSHTHFQAIAGTTSANIRTNVEAAVQNLREHGYTGRLTALVSEADVAKYIAMDGFVKYVPADITTVAGNANAPVYVAQRELEGMPGEIFGLYLSDKGGTVILRSDAYIPTGYGALLKSFGVNNPMNPLAVRVHPTTDFGLRLDPQGTKSLVNPVLEKVMLYGTHGVGVNNRLAAVAWYNGGGSWTNPTFV